MKLAVLGKIHQDGLDFFSNHRIEVMEINEDFDENNIM